MDDYQLLGPILHLQIQKEILRTGSGADQVYGTEKLAAVDSLVLTPDGPLARIDGGWVLDRHHMAHPANAEGSRLRLLSIGFTAHYAAMAEHFGSAAIGDAGENIVVETDSFITAEQLAGGILIKRPGPDIELEGAAVAEPCIPFTKFRLGDPQADPDVITPNRDFLRGGMRGYVMGLENLTGAVAIDLGDLVYARAS